MAPACIAKQCDRAPAISSDGYSCSHHASTYPALIASKHGTPSYNNAMHVVSRPSPSPARLRCLPCLQSKTRGLKVKALLHDASAHPCLPPSPVPIPCPISLPSLPTPSPPLYPFQLPKLSTLVYEGPRDRRQTGLDITHALQQLLEAATAATTASAAPPAAAQGSGSSSSASSRPQQPPQQLGCQQVMSGSACGVGLTVLECVAGSLPDVLLEVVGRLRGLVRLKLSSTTALHMAPVSNLTALTAITMTVRAWGGWFSHVCGLSVVILWSKSHMACMLVLPSALPHSG